MGREQITPAHRADSRGRCNTSASLSDGADHSGVCCWRFPTRNRIIAGCSDVLLVVEAGMKGGALITARIALEYGVPVYAVPGDVDRSTSVGTNLLIRDGAFPVLGPEDLAEVLDLLSPLYGVANVRS
ncbi:MAG: hypothetical protein DRJ28_04140 [Actinobacteria bacterium]|nr:MAG: hypothetical protein DRJ28_04140 [Actinomycetota bacterium]